MSTPRPAVALPAQYPLRVSSTSSKRSISSSTSPTVMSSTSTPTSMFNRLCTAVPSNILKQLKLVLPGAVITYSLDTIPRLRALLDRPSHPWQRLYAQSSLVVALLSVICFLYLILVPWIKGVQPNYSQWRQSSELSFVVPTLTVLLVLGWPLLSYTLSHCWTDLGLIKGVVASSGLYGLSLGLLGLIPVPAAPPQPNSHRTD